MRLQFSRGAFLYVLHTFSGKMADIAEQAEIVWCFNSSETEFVVCFLAKTELTVMMMAKTLWDLCCWYGCL